MNAWKLANTRMFSCGRPLSRAIYTRGTQPSPSTFRHVAFSMSCCHLLAIQLSTMRPSVCCKLSFLALFNSKIIE